jgi:hypothetical protein
VGVSTSIDVLPPDSIERTLTGKARRVHRPAQGLISRIHER